MWNGSSGPVLVLAVMVALLFAGLIWCLFLDRTRELPEEIWDPWGDELESSSERADPPYSGR